MVKSHVQYSSWLYQIAHDMHKCAGLTYFSKVLKQLFSFYVFLCIPFQTFLIAGAGARGKAEEGGQGEEAKPPRSQKQDPLHNSIFSAEEISSQQMWTIRVHSPPLALFKSLC